MIRNILAVIGAGDSQGVRIGIKVVLNAVNAIILASCCSRKTCSSFDNRNIKRVAGNRIALAFDNNIEVFIAKRVCIDRARETILCNSFFG